jgi:D-alanyl-lipoteichoic acid acyltransferase DltB (MBOAT superfamily)
MTFSSLSFFVFLFIIFCLVAVFPARYRWLLLLIASYFFYACLKAPFLLIVLAAVTAISYACGILIYQSEKDKFKLFWLCTGIVANLFCLIWLKYVPFLIENYNIILGWFTPRFSLAPSPKLVAIGVSYFVFQGISYLIDIYIEKLEPERHPGIFALSMSFFPKLLQGPIERSGKILPQLREISIGSGGNLRTGVNLLLLGMFKKSVIADRLATFVDPVYNNAHAYYGLTLLVATYLFALQIYFDFSGYTDMALGIGRFFNIRLTQNFNSPYMATSTVDFWRRWHISFSSWILDYIFKPLQFSFRNWPRWGTPFALMCTFLVSGLWHGASWCFVVWGSIHGVYLSFATLFRKKKRQLWKILGLEKSRILYMLQIVGTFHLVCFSWIFFRANNLEEAIHISASISGIPLSLRQLSRGDNSCITQILPSGNPKDLLTVLLFIMLVTLISLIDRKTSTDIYNPGELQWISKIPGIAQGFVYAVLCYVIAFDGASAQNFIYLQF